MNEFAEENFDQDEDEEGRFTTPEQMRRYHEKMAKEDAEFNAEEERRFERAVDSDGKFKNLKAKFEYEGQELPRWLPGSPDPKDYSADDEQHFWYDLNMFNQTGRLGGNLDPRPDDERRLERNEKLKNIAEYRRQAALAEARGDRENVARYNWHARLEEKDLAAMPKSKRQQTDEEAAYQFGEEMVDQLFDPDMAEDPSWDNERMQHDTAIYLAEHNRKAKRYLRLPLEKDGRAGNIAPCKPGNMIKFDLPEDVMERLKRHVYSHPDLTADQIFRRTWAFLWGSGYAPTGELAVKNSKSKKPKEKKKITRHPDNMSQSEYEAWREKQGASQF